MFAAAKLLGLIAHPSIVVFALIVVGVVARRGGLALAGVVLLLAIVLLPLDDWAARPLENRFSRPDPARVDGIVVLGGAVDEAVSADRGTPSLTGAASRLLALSDLSRRWPEAKIVFTGGSGRIDPGPVVEADIVRGLLPALGISSDRVRFDRRSRTTAENAAEALSLAEPRPDQCWLLVTSALHMPRAKMELRAVGFAVAPWPAGYTTRRGSLEWLEPPATRLGRLDAAAHERAGLLEVTLRQGRLLRVTPAPVQVCNEQGPP